MLPWLRLAGASPSLGLVCWARDHLGCSLSTGGAGSGLGPFFQALAHIPSFQAEASRREDGDVDGQASPPGSLEWWKSVLAPPPAKAPAKPFILASNISPVPPKLVAKIQALEFVSMRDLLPDNIALAERLEALPRSSSAQPHPQREIDSITSWASAFLMYIAVINEAMPQKTRGLLAYMRSILGEARRNECFSWKTYDTIFRKNAAADPSKDWSVLDHSLHAACLQAPSGSKTPNLCSLCAGADHTSVDCALSSVQIPSSSAAARPKGNPPDRGLEKKTPRICLSWNRGNCAFPGACNFLHVCASCRSPSHAARECPATPADSLYKRPPPTKRRAGDER